MEERPCQPCSTNYGEDDTEDLDAQDELVGVHAPKYRPAGVRGAPGI